MSVVRTEAYYNSSDSVHKIRTLIWKEENLSPIGVIQIAHGMAEHIGRYNDFAEFLALNGFVVCGNDHLGHGKSVNDASELGFFAQTNGHIRIVDDMHILTKIMKNKYPDIPYFLFGHSMGSLCARVYTTHFGNELSGVIFCGTAELPAVAGTLQPAVDLLCERLDPHTKIDRMGDLFNKLQCLGIKNKKSDLEWISKSIENQKKYADDELCGFTFTIGAYRDVFALANEASSRVWASTVPKDLAVLIISGALDPVGLNGRGVLAVSDNLVMAGKEPTVILYPGDRHEILNEEDNERVYKDILSWLNSIYIS